MAPSFRDSGKYKDSHISPNGPGDARPTALQIIQNNDLVGKLNDKAILLTGGSNGLGVEEVRALALTGASITFTARDLSKGEKVKNDILRNWAERTVEPKVQVLQMELESLDSVRKAVEEFKKEHDRLHVLVNNAGRSIVFKLHRRQLTLPQESVSLHTN